MKKKTRFQQIATVVTGIAFFVVGVALLPVALAACAVLLPLFICALPFAIYDGFTKVPRSGLAARVWGEWDHDPPAEPEDRSDDVCDDCRIRPCCCAGH